MGRAARFACIFTPMALTIASFVCLLIIELSGWTPNGSLSEYWFVQADFSQLHIDSSINSDNATILTGSLEWSRDNGLLKPLYEVHLWNYCAANSTADDSKITYCSPRTKEYYFDPINVWGLNRTAAINHNANPSGSELSKIKNNTEALENKILGTSAREALDAYGSVSKWMFIAYEVSFWSTLLTILIGVLAIFSRWGSFLTWILAFVSSIFTLASVITSTILFSAFVGAFKAILDPYKVQVHLGTHALAITWLAVLFSWAATLFWLFSVCCCSGRNNPHHKSNKGGLWNAAAREGDGYGGGRRAFRVEKTGGNYERVASPYLGAGDRHIPAHAQQGDYADRVPLAQYPAQPGQGSAAYEPFRHA